MLSNKLLIFRLGNGKYACDTNYVDRIIKYENLTYLPSLQPSLEGLYNYEGQVIKIYNIAILLGIDIKNEGTNKKIIIIKNKDVLVGFVVNEVLEVFNYLREIEDKTRDIKSAINVNQLDFQYVKDMILINDEIVIYLRMDKIVDKELGESDE